MLLTSPALFSFLAPSPPPIGPVPSPSVPRKWLASAPGAPRSPEGCTQRFACTDSRRGSLPRRTARRSALRRSAGPAESCPQTGGGRRLLALEHCPTGPAAPPAPAGGRQNAAASPCLALMGGLAGLRRLPSRRRWAPPPRAPACPRVPTSRRGPPARRCQIHGCQNGLQLPYHRVSSLGGCCATPPPPRPPQGPPRRPPYVIAGA